jgi:hypothetical protein
LRRSKRDPKMRIQHEPARGLAHLSSTLREFGCSHTSEELLHERYS